MTRRCAMTTVLIAGLFATLTSSAQKRPYDQLMKEIAQSFASLKKNLDASAAEAAAADAAKLEGLFRETEAFWAPFKTKDALDAAMGAREAVSTAGAAAREKNIQKAQASYAGVGKYCTGCHNAHREQMPDKTYRIRP